MPPKLRKLTRDEAARLGVSYTSKRRVDASIKRVTKRTRLYTDRQVAEAKLGMTKAEYTAINKHRTVRKIIHGKMVHYTDLSEKQFFELLHKFHTNLVNPHFYIDDKTRYKEGGYNWISIEKIKASQIANGWPSYKKRHKLGHIFKYGVTVYA